VLGLFARVPRVAGGRCRVGQRHDGVPVFAGVERELGASELAALPARVERVAEDVPAVSRCVDPIDEAHVAPFASVATPRDRSYASGGS
jgi:hypothetical protein